MGWFPVNYFFLYFRIADPLHLGTFSADEHMAGLDPSRGTELCAVAYVRCRYK